MSKKSDDQRNESMYADDKLDKEIILVITAGYEQGI